MSRRKVKRRAGMPDRKMIINELEDGLALACTAFMALNHAIDGVAIDPEPDLGQIARTLDFGLARIGSAISEADKALALLSSKVPG